MDSLSSGKNSSEILDALLPEIATICSSLTDQTKDLQLLQQLVLDETDHRRNGRALWHSLLLRVKLFQELKLLSEEQLVQIQAEYDALPLIIPPDQASIHDYDSLHRNGDFEHRMSEQLMDKIARSVPEPSGEAVSYRQSARSQMEQRLAKFREKDKENPLMLAQELIEFVGEQNETWLDIALIQTATKMSVTGTASELDQVRILAWLLMGENSRVQRRLDHFKQMSYWDHLRPGAVLPISVPGVILCSYMLTFLSQMEGPIGPKILMYFYVLIPALFSAGASSYAVKKLVSAPAIDSRQAISKHYQQMEVPAEVQSFVRLMLEVQKWVVGLPKLNDPQEIAGRLKELEMKASEAIQLISANRDLFGRVPSDEEKIPKAAREKKKIRIAGPELEKRCLRVQEEKLVPAVVTDQAAGAAEMVVTIDEWPEEKNAKRR